MRRIGVVALALLAAFAAPVRAACGATCVPPPAIEMARPAPACHETAPVDSAAPEPGRCSHDHSASLRPAPRATADTVEAVQAGVLAPPPGPFVTLATRAFVDLPRGSSRGSPPPRLLPLRI